MLFLAQSDPSFLINLLEKGGLPALALGIIFLIFFSWVKSQAKQQTKRDEAQAEATEKREQAQVDAFVALQKERIAARKRNAQKYTDLMSSYEDIVEKFLNLSIDTTQAITRLSERVGQCPLKDHASHMLIDTSEGSDDC